MVIRICYKQLGGHIHCRVFSAKAKNMTFALHGVLVFSEGREWDTFRDIMQSAIEFLPEEEIENLSGHDLSDV